jgi:hypothetical protein
VLVEKINEDAVVSSVTECFAVSDVICCVVDGSKGQERRPMDGGIAIIRTSARTRKRKLIRSRATTRRSMSGESSTRWNIGTVC